MADRHAGGGKTDGFGCEMDVAAILGSTGGV